MKYLIIFHVSFIIYCICLPYSLLFSFQDILISGAPKAAETTNAAKRMNESHLANQLHYSFRVRITWLSVSAQY